MRVLVLLLMILLLSFNVEATAIGVSRAVISFDDVLKGGYAEDSFIASTDSIKEVYLEYELLGDTADWITIQSNDNLKISTGNPETLRVIVEPPSTLANGKYEGILRVTTSEIARNEGQFGSVIKSAFRIKIEVTITGRQTQSCVVGGVGISDAEYIDELELSATIKNNGNVDLNPSFEIDIWNAEQTKLLKTINLDVTDNIRPTQTNTLYRSFTHDLELGQYFADIIIDQCPTLQKSTFEILDRGGVADKGVLTQVYNKAWAKTNDIVPITGNFQNLGKRTVSVKLKGTIEKDGRIVRVVDTDLVDVSPGDSIKLETFFNPEDSGKYLIKLRALYNGKLTFEKESVLNVNPSGEVPTYITFKTNWYPIAIFILAVIAVTLLFMIKKKNTHKKRKRH